MPVFIPVVATAGPWGPRVEVEEEDGSMDMTSRKRRTRAEEENKASTEDKASRDEKRETSAEERHTDTVTEN